MSRGNRILLSALIALATSAAGLDCARAESDFFKLEEPPSLNLTFFLSGYGSDRFGTTHEGFELERSLTRYVSLVGRVISYEVYQGSGYDSPLIPGKNGTRNFGRFQGGVDLTPMEGVSLIIMGGHDVGDSDAPVIEGDFSSWFGLHSLHPFNFAFSSTHYFENEVTSNRIDLRSVLFSRAEYMVLGGMGGAIWGGGTVGGPKGQGGPDVGIYLRKWRSAIDLQVGYGSSNGYGLISFSKQFHW
jgi:hypothetical protein